MDETKQENEPRGRKKLTKVQSAKSDRAKNEIKREERDGKEGRNSKSAQCSIRAVN